MSKREVITCDECGKFRSEANHWHIARVDGPSFISERGQSGIKNWNDYCPDCIKTAFQRFLNTGSIEKKEK